MIFRDETSGKDLRLTQPEAQQALLLYEKVVREGRGRVVFISGEEGVGKTDVLQVLADAFLKSQPQPLLMAGRFNNGTYSAWDIGKQKPFPTNEAFAASGEATSSAAQIITNFVTPEIKFAVEFIGQALQTIGAALDFSESYGERHQRLFSGRDFKNLIRDASRTRPLICLLDDFHEADPQWNYLLLEVAREVASERPVLIFATLDGPDEPGEHTEDESNLLYLVRELIKLDLAEWWLMKPLSREEIAARLGQSALGMTDRLRSVTGGNARLLIRLWKDWQHRNVVKYSQEDDRWVWGTNRTPSVDLAKDVLEERLKTLLRSTGWEESEGLKEYDEIRTLLGCAALEGPVFTAQALALLLGRDEDELIDYLDDVLTQSEERPHGILKGEDYGIKIEDPSTGNRTLWRYSFVDYLYYQAAKRFLIREEQSQIAPVLARALIETYSPEERQVAGRLAELFRAGKDSGAALHYQRMSDYAAMREGLRQHAFYLLSIDKDDWDEWMCRQVTALFLEAGRKMLNAYPHEETLAVFEAACEMARRSNLRLEQALAIYYCGMLNVGLGNYITGREKTKEAFLIFQKLKYRGGEAVSLRQLGSIELELGDYEAARELTLQSLEINVKMGDRAHEAMSLHQLGSIELELDNYESARDMTQQSLDVSVEIGDRSQEAMSLHKLGSIELEFDNYELARHMTQQSLDIRQEIGDPSGESKSLYQLGSTELELGNYESARNLARQSLEIARRIGNRVDEAVCWNLLGLIAEEKGVLVEGAKLVALSWLIRRSINPVDAQSVEQNLIAMANDLGYTEEQIKALIEEVSEAYQTDGGRKLLEDAFGKE